jgi:endonuclease/exonuclease/phosphatase family metal-dependent hydrolase
VQLGCGLWVVNLHATAGDAPAAGRDVALAATAAREWTAGAPLVFGGDLNLRGPSVAGLRVVASREVDHLLVGDGVNAAGEAAVLDSGTLSDHPPLAVDVAW